MSYHVVCEAQGVDVECSRDDLAFLVLDFPTGAHFVVEVMS